MRLHWINQSSSINFHVLYPPYEAGYKKKSKLYKARIYVCSFFLFISKWFILCVCIKKMWWAYFWTCVNSIDLFQKKNMVIFISTGRTILIIHLDPQHARIRYELYFYMMRVKSILLLSTYFVGQITRKINWNFRQKD